MAEHPMETTLRTALWRQFGAAIDMLENALLACPSTHWNERLWSDPEAPDYPTFWSLTYHTLFWLDLYLTGQWKDSLPLRPSRIRLTQGVLPKQPYTRDELHAYLVHLRQKCQINDRRVVRRASAPTVPFPWDGGIR